MQGCVHEALVEQEWVEPSGLERHPERLFAADHAHGGIVACDLRGRGLGSIRTDAAGSMGIPVGPDGKLCSVDADSGQGVRIDP